VTLDWIHCHPKANEHGEVAGGLSRFGFAGDTGHCARKFDSPVQNETVGNPNSDQLSRDELTSDKLLPNKLYAVNTGCSFSNAL
jgi:hypothetical protein